MPKRKSNESKILRYEQKIKKLKESDETRRRRRVIIYSDSESETENPLTHESESENHVVNVDQAPAQEAENVEVTDLVEMGSPPTQETSPTEEPEIDSEYKEALGVPAEEKPVYGPRIHQSLADRWLPILRRGLSKDSKDDLLKDCTIPENCKLLRAPTLNPEISAAISEAGRTRDKKFENAQQQLGLGISTTNRALTVLVTGGDDKETKVKAVKLLSDSCRVLCDLHYTQTQTRIKNIIPGLDKSFSLVVEDVVRDEYLFGDNLSEKIKASKAIEKQGLQIKRGASAPKPASSASQSTSRSRYQGNWTAPSRYQYQPSNRGGRAGGPKSTAAAQRATAPPAAAPAPARSASHGKRGARRN